VFHPQPQLLRVALEIIGVATSVEVHDGERPALRAVIATPRGEVTLTG
jgi:hypothetical protein